MKIGRFTIEQLSEGHFRMFSDGSYQKMEQIQQPELTEADKYTQTVGIDPILISDGDHHILLDTGLGWGLDAGSGYKKVSNVKTNLDIFGLRPEDITHVILTHLHFDHAAGSTYNNGDNKTTATFPNATYYIQKREWDYALAQIQKPQVLKGGNYKLDELYRLAADKQLTFLDTNLQEPIRGIKILWSGGHTPGHQIVKITDDGESAYFLGDLLPSEHHLNHYAMRQFDAEPLQAKKVKIQLLRKAFEEEAYLLFYHSLFSKNGVLIKDKHRNYILKEE